MDADLVDAWVEVLESSSVAAAAERAMVVSRSSRDGSSDDDFGVASLKSVAPRIVAERSACWPILFADF